MCVVLTTRSGLFLVQVQDQNGFRDFVVASWDHNAGGIRVARRLSMQGVVAVSLFRKDSPSRGLAALEEE